MKPTVQMNTSSGRQEVTLEALHLADRRIFLTGQIDDELANGIIQSLLWLDSESHEPIEIYINSPGGSVSAGLAIYDVLQTLQAPVDMICVGIAASMGAVLFSAGARGHRFIYPHARVMIHEAYVSGGIGGSAMSVQNTAAEMLRTQQTINEILARHTGHEVPEIEQAASYDHYMSAGEAIAFGICDEIVGAGAGDGTEKSTDNTGEAA